MLFAEEKVFLRTTAGKNAASCPFVVYFAKDSFIIYIPYSHARKVAGNSVSVPVIQAIAGEMIKALDEQEAAVKYKELNLFGDYDYIGSKASVR